MQYCVGNVLFTKNDSKCSQNGFLAVPEAIQVLPYCLLRIGTKGTSLYVYLSVCLFIYLALAPKVFSTHPQPLK